VGLALAAFAGGSLLAGLIARAIRRLLSRDGVIMRQEHELAVSREEQQRWKHEFEEEARKRREVTAFIESIQGERETWKNLYLTAGREHGVAQELMMRKIEQLARVAKREVPSELKALMAEYRGKHGPEATLKISERIEHARLPGPEHLEATEGIATTDPSAYSAKP
jgi:hypothetical protein